MKHSSKVIYATLLISIAIHLGLLLSNLFAPKVVIAPEVLQPVTVTLQQYTLDEPKPVETTPEPIKTEAPTQKEAPAPSKPQQTQDTTPKNNTVLLPVNPKRPQGPKTMAQMQQQPLEARQTPDEPLNTNPEQDNQADAEPKEPILAKTTDTKLTLQDIKHNNGIIAPKAGQEPRFPKNAVLRFQGPASVTGTMRFQSSGSNYTIVTEFKIPFYAVRLDSAGRIKDGNQFVPEKFTDKRKGKLYSHATFDYDNQVIKYGKASEDEKEMPMEGIPQDYLSLAWQMAIKGGKLNQPTQIASGKTVHVQSDFAPKGEMELDVDGGNKLRIQVFHINKGEDSMNFSFASDYANVPAQIIVNIKNNTYTLNLIAINMDGKEYWEAIRRSGASKIK